jgi:LPXTG-motif cell wall-anchored protein
MYGSGSGGSAFIGGTGASVLAYTGTGSMVLPLIIAAAALALGVALIIRKRAMARLVAH